MLELLKERSLLWLSGVRRVGKTTLCRSIDSLSYFDCELPSVRGDLEDPEFFFRQQKSNNILCFDEIHRLTNPSQILKVGADHFPHLKIIATGSSTLAAKSKFSDTLTGRKHSLWLLPTIAEDLVTFKIDNLEDRMLKGGLPPFLLAEKIQDRDYIEWIDSYWAKDVQELFRVEKRASFIKFIELLFRQSGQLFEAQAFAGPCEISRQTVINYLSVLETTLLTFVLRPFNDKSPTEIKSQPKVFGFDTGFVCFFRGISELRDEDRGLLLEHLALNELLSIFDRSEIFYWRDKQKHEVDFVIKTGRSKELIAIECKTKSRYFDPAAMQSFRRRYPEGPNFVLCSDTEKPMRKSISGLEVCYCNLADLQSLRKSI